MTVYLFSSLPSCLISLGISVMLAEPSKFPSAILSCFSPTCHASVRLSRCHFLHAELHFNLGLQKQEREKLSKLVSVLSRCSQNKIMLGLLMAPHERFAYSPYMLSRVDACFNIKCIETSLIDI